jgi:hypothetical protein
MLTGIMSNHLIAAPASSGPTVDLIRSVATPATVVGEALVGLTNERAHLRMPEGRIDIERESLAVRFTTAERLLDHAVLHPYLAFPAAVVSHWSRRLALHAGAVITERGAVAILGDKGAGKSTLVATLAQLGAKVLTDDLLVIDGGDAFAGPRSVDLRPDMAAAAPMVNTVDLGVVGARSRHRFTPTPVPWSAPLAGIVHLAIGNGLAMTPVPLADRLTTIANVAALGPTTVPTEAALALTALPTWRLTRPRARTSTAVTPDAVTAPAELLLRLVA